MFDYIAKQLLLGEKQVRKVITMFEEGATIPFIARYRKDQTENLNERQLEQILNLMDEQKKLEKRKVAILETLQRLEVNDPKLIQQIKGTTQPNVLEDLYLPYKPKRKTRATKAREKGLLSLANWILDNIDKSPYLALPRFLPDGVEDEEEAVEGAKDIIAEWLTEQAVLKDLLRKLFARKAVLKTKVAKDKEQEAENFKHYFNFEIKANKIQAHQYLAIYRAELLKYLQVSIAPEEEEALYLMRKHMKWQYLPPQSVAEDVLKDAYRRLFRPSLANEIHQELKAKADDDSISIFNENLEQLLMAAPLGNKAVMALDPGFQSGVKLVCLDRQGKLEEHTVIYPTKPKEQIAEATATMQKLVKKHRIEAIAIGNGTASRETERFVRNIEFHRPVVVQMVNESGASIYSASEVAREEFPHHDITVRGAVSIGRRLQDPLGELVKLPPKSLGIGQYQHDIDQNKLKLGLDRTVASCVNRVGLNINTASKHLLNHLSGIGPQLAANIIEYRNLNGAFKSKKELLKVPRLGEKAFEQSAGFIRVPSSLNPLDSSGIHPEDYSIVEEMAKDLGTDVFELMHSEKVRQKINYRHYISQQNGEYTLRDIVRELGKPGLDPREHFKPFTFDERVQKIGDLREGMRLPGMITNITNFGAFVDLGVHQDGLVHISKLSHGFVQNPAEVVFLGQEVDALVIDVDENMKRISLSLID